ncbi:MAG: DoxX family membrane protein, partial [Solirubrobacterales bacterium]
MRVVRYLLGVFFVFAGANHFISPDLYLEMMPSWLPLHGPAVFWSGVAEMAGGVMLFFDRTAKAGGVFLILILVAIFPANVNAAIDPAGPDNDGERHPWRIRVVAPATPAATARVLRVLALLG